MSAAFPSFADIRASLRYDALLRAEKDAFYAAKGAAAGGLRIPFRPTSALRFLFEWALPVAAAVLMPAGSDALLWIPIAFGFVFPGISGERAATASVFRALRYPSRASALFSRLLQRAPKLIWWGMASAIAASRLRPENSTMFLAAVALSPICFALDTAYDGARRDSPGNERGRPLCFPLWMCVLGLLGLSLLANLVFDGAFAAFGRIAFGFAVFFVAFTTWDLPRAVASADVVPTVRDRTIVASRPAFRPVAVPAAPGSGLLASHVRLAIDELRSASVRTRIAWAVTAAFFIGFAVVVVASGDTWPTSAAVVGAWSTALFPNVLRVRHAERLALLGVAPRALRLHDLKTFVGGVVSIVAIGAVAALVVRGGPTPLWTNLYGSIAALFVLRLGWTGLDLTARVDDPLRTFSIWLRYLGMAATFAIATPVGPIPAALIGVVGLVALGRRLDAPIWDPNEGPSVE